MFSTWGVDRLMKCHLCSEVYKVPNYVRTVVQWEDIHFKACATKVILEQLNTAWETGLEG